MLGWLITVRSEHTVVARWEASLGGLSWLYDQEQYGFHGGYPDCYRTTAGRVREVVADPPSLYMWMAPQNIVREPELLLSLADDAELTVEVWDQS